MHRSTFESMLIGAQKTTKLASYLAKAAKNIAKKHIWYWRICEKYAKQSTQYNF